MLTDSSGKMYLNPGEADSIDIILEGIREIVRNYDVDGIHMDDYFYQAADLTILRPILSIRTHIQTKRTGAEVWLLL